MSSSLVSLGCLYLYWKTQRAATEHHVSGEEDSLDHDPLVYTTIKALLFAPSILGIVKFLLFVRGKSSLPAQAWRRVLESHSKYQLLKLAYLSMMAMYFGVGLPNLALDYFKYPQCLYKHKIQKEYEVDYGVMLPKLASTLVQNLLGPMLLSFAMSQAQKDRVAELVFDHVLDIGPDLPSFWQVVRNYWTFACTYDIFFFYSHWALHTKTLYARIHKQHHEWKSPTALAAAYAHPIEYVLSNIAPAAIPLVFAKQHLLSFLLYAHVGLLVTLTDHSGYEFINTSAAHNIHHRTFTSNFGVSGLMDRVYGTRVLDSKD
ncbi:hypothetical protein BASA81_006124 [Batrachochytrium salamandrivorans]|nr:hypothetical protein BASA81_006124 [Batrachochytrium salamandrivorans]